MDFVMNKVLENALQKYLFISIEENLKTDRPFILAKVMKEVYTISYNKDQDVDKALSIAGSFPKWLLLILRVYPWTLHKLEEKGFRRDPIIELNKEISDSDKPLAIVSKYLI